MNTAAKLTTLILCAAFMSGCTGLGDSAGNTGPASTTAISSTVNKILTSGLDSGGALSTNQLRATATTAISETSNCEKGGTAEVSGNVDVVSSTSSATVNLDLVAAMTDCTAAGEDSNDYALTGNLNLDSDASMTTSVNNESGTITITVTTSTTGTLDIVGGEINVTGCVIDLRQTNFLVISFSQAGGTVTSTANWTGTVCGESTSGSQSETETL